MIACAHAQRLLPLFYDDELDGPLRRKVHDHIVNCTTCTGVLARLERGQELLRQAVDEQLDGLDFSGFWQGVEGRLSEPRSSRAEQLRVWVNAWQSVWIWRAPAWAAAMAMVIAGAAILFWTLFYVDAPPKSPLLVQREPIVVADSDQAQIESLSATDTVSVWNEPTSNATVIWVGDDGEGGMP
jgi:anti-sigma-K factor RskA